MAREIKVTDKKQVYHDSSPSRVKEMGAVVEMTSYLTEPKEPPCKRLDADTYLDLRAVKTDENGDIIAGIKEYKHVENRGEWSQGIRRTLASIRALINTNVTDLQKCRWVTLTYAENMTDTKRLYEDFVEFWKRFKRYCVKIGAENPEYISVIEPQGRGAWHVHAFFIWDRAAPFIPNDVLRAIWRHGFVKIKAVRGDVDNLGAYFSAYLADMELSELDALSPEEQKKALKAGCEIATKEYTDETGKKVSKRIVKGGRLYLYPRGMQIVRRSKGIKSPEVEKMTYREAKEKVQGATCTFSRTYEVLNNDTESGQTKMVNVITKEYYNRKRKKVKPESKKSLDNLHEME